MAGKVRYKVVGKIFKTNTCGKVEVVKFSHTDSHRKFLIKFLDTGFMTTATSYDIRHGRIKDPFHPTVYRVGCLGL